MPKLATSVDNIQLKSNKVDANIPSSAWTAEQYPSARVLYEVFDKIHPVGSILCMFENKNPYEIYKHGEWELIDKELAHKFHDLSTDTGSGWTPGAATTSELSACLIDGHSMTLRLMLRMITETTNTSGKISGTDSEIFLGAISPEALGLTELPLYKYGIPFTIDQDCLTGNATITQEGHVILNDCWDRLSEDNEAAHWVTTIASIPIHASYTVPAEYMKDEFCNKFYFKRTS